MKATEYVPELLFVLESCIVDKLNTNHILENVPLNTLTHWEKESPILEEELRKTNYYEEQFKLLYPLTYDRLISISREGRFRIERGWRSLLLNLHNRYTQYERVWKETIFPQTERPFNSVSLQDEFGVDCMYQYFPAEQRIRKCGWNDSMTDTVTERYFQLPKESITVQLFSVPFQDLCLVLINNQELFLMQMQRHKDDRQDMRRWALTHNHFPEHPDDFVLPKSLFQSPKLKSVLVAAATQECFSVILNGKTTLFFDSTVKQKQSHQHWRQLLSDEIYEPNHCPNLETVITASCFVLDEFLLIATNDGVLRARPRSNFKSEYYVENINSQAHQMASLFNIVAIIHSYHILEVKCAQKIETDPFLQLNTLYKTNNVDCEHPPLLFGPYVLFKCLDGMFYKVSYESSSFIREEIYIPSHPGSKILSIKSANWRYLSIVAQDQLTKKTSDMYLRSDF
jgi:hypothetical protein